MATSNPLELNSPEDLYQAIVATLRERLVTGVEVVDYADFDFDCPALEDAQILVEFEQSSPTTRSPDGRYGHEYSLVLHGVVGRHRARAGIAAVTLSASIEQLCDDNRWGLPSDQIDAPEQIQSGPSLFKKGAGGYEAWGTRFTQRIYIGESELEESFMVSDIQAASPPDDIDNPDSYQPVEE